MLVLLRSPPDIPFIEMPPMYVFAQLFSPNLLTMSRILTSICLGVRLVLNLAANLKLSIGVKVSRRTSSCYTNAPSLPKSLFIIFLSLHLTSPVIFEPGLSPSLWPRTFKNDVLPLPLDPMIASSCPGFAKPVSPWSICFLPFGVLLGGRDVLGRIEWFSLPENGALLDELPSVSRVMLIMSIPGFIEYLNDSRLELECLLLTSEFLKLFRSDILGSLTSTKRGTSELSWLVFFLLSSLSGTMKFISCHVSNTCLLEACSDLSRTF